MVMPGLESGERSSGEAPPWSRADTTTLSILLILAAIARFWRLGIPGQPVYDEKTVLRQAGSYLRGWPFFLSMHPPLGKLLVAFSVGIFGDHPWSWRFVNASIGTGLVAITYLLARRMFKSRVAAAIAGVLILCEGIFLVASRMAMINIVYVTLAAWAYLMLFRFIQTADWAGRKRTLLAISLLLGLCLGAKAAISATVLLLVTGFLLFSMVRGHSAGRDGNQSDSTTARDICGVLAMLAGIVTIAYIAVFSPYYWFGWWNGIEDLVAYHRWVLDANLVLPSTFAGASPFWSWPLLLRPYAYWKQVGPSGRVWVVWCGGNPAVWWGILVAVPIAALRIRWRSDLAWAFVALGYVAHLAMWIPIRRYIFIYDYMPALYLGLLALAAVLARCWDGSARRWEQLVLLMSLGPVLVLCFGGRIAAIAILAIAITHLLLVQSGSDRSGKFTCAVFVCTAITVFIYFFPLWTCMPITQAGYDARMWLRGPGLVNWI